VFTCSSCHDIVHSKLGVDLGHRYPAVYMQRMLMALTETQARLVGMGLIVVPDGEII
jgi:hypothetical protein